LPRRQTTRDDAQMKDPIKLVDEIIIPAEHGWSVVTLSYGETENSEAYRIPVLAWLIKLHRRPTGETFADVTPVTPNGSLDDVQDVALQYADDPRFFTVHEEFTEEAALLAHFNRRRPPQVGTGHQPRQP